MTNKVNITCGRLGEKANAQQAGHLVRKNKIKLGKKYNIHTNTHSDFIVTVEYATRLLYDNSIK